MKHIVMFLIAAALLAITAPLSAEPTASAPQKAKVSTVEALKGLKLHQSTGVISSIDLDHQNLIIKNRRGEHAFSIVSETQVKKGREKLGQTQLQPGMKVTVRYWEQEGRKIARIIKLIEKLD
jgi:hypothetical protein